jgi:hypothetical protein
MTQKTKLKLNCGNILNDYLLGERDVFFVFTPWIALTRKLETQYGGFDYRDGIAIGWGFWYISLNKIVQFREKL